jgi:hypothetical protein
MTIEHPTKGVEMTDVSKNGKITTIETISKGKYIVKGYKVVEIEYSKEVDWEKAINIFKVVTSEKKKFTLEDAL